MSYKARVNIFDKVTLPTATDGTNSRPFAVPRGARAVTITIPDLVGAGTTLKVQSLQPQDSDAASETWADVKYTSDLASLTFVALAGLTESTVISMNAYLLGGGICRFVASVAQTGAADALTVYLDWTINGG